MSGKIPPPPPKPVSPPNSAQVTTEHLGVMDATQLHDAASSPYFILLSPALAIQGEKEGYPPPPPPHSPPPPNPKSSGLRDAGHEDAPGHPPPPPPHSPPPPPPPRSWSEHYRTAVPTFFTRFMADLIHSYAYGMRIHPTKGVLPSDNIPNPPRPHSDPILPSPPPRVELNKAVDMFAGVDFLCTKTVKLGANLLSPQGGLRGGMVVGYA